MRPTHAATLRYAIVHTQTNAAFPAGHVHILANHPPLPVGCIWCEGQMLPIPEYAALFAVIGHRYAPRMLPPPRPFWRRWWDRLRKAPPPQGDQILTPGMFHVPDYRPQFRVEFRE